ncbi:MAG: hypothetical protein ABSC71_17065 [Candidatus Acidiferrales bacterium]|jgi:hypothetical protein
MAALPAKLQQWQTVLSSGIQLQLRKEFLRKQDDHVISQLSVSIVNGNPQRVTAYDCVLWVPTALLAHFAGVLYALEERNTGDPNTKKFRVSEQHFGPIMPEETKRLMTVDICNACAHNAFGGVPGVVGGLKVKATAWVGAHVYSTEKSIVELTEEEESRKPR